MGFKAAGFEFHVGKRQERRPLFGEQFADRLLLPRRGLGVFLAALSFQVFVKCREVPEFRDRDHEVPADVTDGVLRMSLLLRFVNVAEIVFEKIVRFQLQQAEARFLATPSDDLADVHFRVVELDLAGNASEEGESPFQRFLEGLGTFAGKGLYVTHITVRQGKDGIGHLLADAAENRFRKAEIELGVAARM